MLQMLRNKRGLAMSNPVILFVLGFFAVGVIGVGSMGQHHARVYNSLQDADLVGVDAEHRRRDRRRAPAGRAGPRRPRRCRWIYGIPTDPQEVKLLRCHDEAGVGLLPALRRPSFFYRFL